MNPPRCVQPICDDFFKSEMPIGRPAMGVFNPNPVSIHWLAYPSLLPKRITTDLKHATCVMCPILFTTSTLTFRPAAVTLSSRRPDEFDS